MKTQMMTVLFLAACGGATNAEPTTAASAPVTATEEAAPSTFTEHSVDEVAALLDASQAVAADANSESTRSTLGTLPGAIQLTGHDDYALTQLPEDRSKGLVFYCRNQSCRASHVAAQRAIDNGYTNVSILPAGIEGWRAAGKAADTVFPPVTAQ